MRRSELELPDFDWSPVEVGHERHRAATWLVGLFALGVLVALVVLFGFGVAFGLARNPMAILLGPFALLGALL